MIMNNYTNEEIGIIVSALKYDKNALNIFLNGLDNSKILINKEIWKSIIYENNISTNDILQIDLSELFEDEIKKTIEFFYAHSFPKLEKLVMPQHLNIQDLETTVFGIFREDRIDTFLSLEEIFFGGNTTENMFHTIFNHFNLYNNFTRKIHQYSEYHGTNCVYISIKNIGSLNLNNKKWLKGFSLNNVYLVKNVNGTSEKSPLVICVRR